MKAVFQLVRLPAGFSAISNVIAAHLLMTHGDLQWLILTLSILASLCLYFGGMALNDCFDFNEDRRNRANRPLPNGQITLNRAWILSVGLIFSGVILALLIGVASFVLAIVLAAMIILYDSKILNPIPSAIAMGACRYLNWLFAMSFVGFSGIALELPLALFFYVTGLTLLSKAEVRVESKKPFYQAIVFFFFCLMVLLYQAFMLDTSILIPVIAIVLFTGFIVKTLLPVSREFAPYTVQAAIGALVMGVIIVDATLLAVYGYPVFAVCILLLLIPGKSLGRRLYVS